MDIGNCRLTISIMRNDEKRKYRYDGVGAEVEGTSTLKRTSIYSGVYNTTITNFKDERIKKIMAFINTYNYIQRERRRVRNVKKYLLLHDDVSKTHPLKRLLDIKMADMKKECVGTAPVQIRGGV